ncbi:MAG: type VI secretion system lipoprotein TssJ [Desulfobacteraceae bacterium]|nr:type VI secretion system lipoprotein TssJ [Desulfobacteraceae bacterium]MBC2754367.1 type VI secretion system lipoprotein TssJ [Desulfobacteraceae bacterium]
MIHKSRYILLILILFSISACASQPLRPPEWKFEKSAIKLHVFADDQLNLNEGTPHTLWLCIYQLKDPNEFNHLAGFREGLYQLLECGHYDSTVTTASRLIVHPGQDRHFVFDRAEGAKYLAVVAGYYTIQKEHIIRLTDMPVIIERSGFLWLKKTQKPGAINIELTLGPKHILTFKGN